MVSQYRPTLKLAIEKIQARSPASRAEGASQTLRTRIASVTICRGLSSQAGKGPGAKQSACTVPASASSKSGPDRAARMVMVRRFQPGGRGRRGA